MTKKPLTTFEMAKFCQVTHRAVLKWIAEGKLRSYRTPGNHSRVHRDDFLAFLKVYNMPVPEELLRGDKKRVLVVDDDKLTVTLIKRIIKKCGDYDIEEAFDGFSAGKKFIAFQPDLITLDIQMPHLNGLEVLKQVRQEADNTQTKVMVITSIDDDNVRKQAIALGADEFIVKPFVTKNLIERVGKLLED